MFGCHFSPGRLLLSVLAFLLVTVAPAWSSPPAGANQLDDPRAALAAIFGEPTLISFNAELTGLPRGGHLQGVQARFDAAHDRNLVFLSHDSETVGYLVVVEFPADWKAPGRVLRVLTFPSDGAQPPLRHAGGFQLCDNVLAVGLEDNQQKTRSEVQFWDVAEPSDPKPLKHLTVRRAGAAKEQTAGAVGLIQSGGQHVLAVANWDSRAIDLYVATKAMLTDPECRFEPRQHWQVEQADKSAWKPDGSWGGYQAINLATDAAGQLYVFGFWTSPTGDRSDLYRLDFQAPLERMLQKVDTRVLKLSPGHRFQFAAGAAFERGQLWLLASPRTLSARTAMSLFRPPVRPATGE